MRVPRISLGKLLNVLQSPIGRMASWPMRNIKTFPSKQMYLYLSLVERKEAEFYHNIDRRRWLVWVEMTYFHRFFRTIHGVLALMDFSHPSHIGCSQSMASCWQGSSHPRKALIPWWSHEKILPMNFLRLLAVSMEHLNVTNYLQCGSSVE